MRALKLGLPVHYRHRCALSLLLLTAVCPASAEARVQIELTSIKVIDIADMPAIDLFDGKSRFPSKPALRIDVSTKTNLRSAASGFNSANPYVTFTLCERSHSGEELSSPIDIFDASGVLKIGGKTRTGLEADAVSFDGNYHVYVDLQTTIEILNGTIEEVGKVDLAAGKDDLCLQLFGGTMLGIKWRSNVLRIDKGSIAAAVASSKRKPVKQQKPRHVKSGN